MRAIIEKLALIFVRQLFSSLVLFLSSRIGKKRSFNKAFDINSWPLAKDHIREEIDLSFAGY